MGIAIALLLFGFWTLLCVLFGAALQYRRQNDLPPVDLRSEPKPNESSNGEIDDDVPEAPRRLKL